MKYYHGFDAIRSITMIMGVIAHAISPFTSYINESFSILSLGIAVPNPWAGWIIFLTWIHQWQMPVFFLLSGFLSGLMLEKYGHVKFLSNRFMRITCVMLLFKALSLFGGVQWFELNHLWFLWTLSQLCLITFILCSMKAEKFLKPFLWIFKKPSRLMLLFLPMLLIVMFGKNDLFVYPIPLNLLRLDLQAIFCYGFFFLIGLGLWKRREVMDSIISRPIIYSSLIMSSFLLNIMLFLLTENIIGELLPIQESLSKIRIDNIGMIKYFILALLVSSSTICFIFGFIAACNALVKQSSRVLKFLVDSAYSVYLLHFYPQMFLNVALVSIGCMSISLFH